MWIEREKDKILGVWDVYEVRLRNCRSRICWTLPSITKENRSLHTLE